MIHDHTTKGITYALIAALLYAIMAIFVQISLKHVPVIVIVSFRFWFSLITILPFCLMDQTFSFKINHKWLFLLRSLCGIAGLTCFFYTLQHLNVADATLLVNTTPIYVPLIVLLFTGTRTHRGIWAGIAISFIGVLCIIDPTSSIFNWHALVGVASGIFAAFAVVFLRLINKYQQPKQALFYYFAIGSVMTGVVVPFTWHHFAARYWLFLFIIGLIGAIYQTLLTKAIQYAQIRLVSPLLLSAALFGGIFAWILLDQIPAWNSFIGAVVLFIGMWVVVNFSNRNKRG